MAALDYPDKLSNKKSIANRLLVLLFIITSLSMVILIVLSLIVPPAMDTMVETFTAAEPLDLPQIEFTETEKQDVKDSLNEFEKALKADKYVEPLKLDARQLNGLLAEDKKSSNVHLSIEHDTIRAELSLPIDTDLELGPWQSSMRGRYINGNSAKRAISSKRIWYRLRLRDRLYPAGCVACCSGRSISWMCSTRTTRATYFRNSLVSNLRTVNSCCILNNWYLLNSEG